MGKFLKRTLSIVLALILVVSLIPAMAQETEDVWTTETMQKDGAFNPAFLFCDKSGWTLHSEGIMVNTTNTEAASIAFSFTGTGLRVMAYLNNQDGGDEDTIVDAWHNNNHAYVRIDGVDYPLTLQSETHIVKKDYVCFETTELPEGNHTAVIYTSKPISPVTSGSLNIHSASVLNGEFTTDVTFTPAIVDGELNPLINWTNFTNQNAGSGRAYATVGGKADFVFNGTGLILYASINNQDGNGDMLVDAWHNNNNVTISIDGGEPVRLNTQSNYRVVRDDCVVYYINNLTDGIHTAEINVNAAISPVTSGAFNLYKVGVEGGTIVDYEWNEYKTFTGSTAEGNIALNTQYFTFNGTWTAEDVVGGDAAKNSNAIGETMSFDFEGDALRVTAFVNCQDPNNDGVAEAVYTNDNIYISIDGGEPIAFNMVRDTHTVAYTTVCEVAGLSEGMHTAVITSGARKSDSSGYDAVIQSVSIANGQLVTWNEYKTYNGASANANLSLNKEYFEFIGTWVAEVILNQDTAVNKNALGEKISFDFEGDALRVTAFVNCQDTNNDGVADINYNNDNVYITIDGGEPVALSVNREVHTVGYLTVFEVFDLTEGEHTAVITSGVRNSEDAGYNACIQSVAVANGELASRAKSVTVNVGEGGTCNQATQTALIGETIKFVFTPNEGYEVADVEVNGAPMGALSEITLTIADTTEISVTFKKAYTWNEYKTFTGSAAEGNIALNTQYFTFNGTWTAKNVVSGDAAVNSYANGESMSFDFTGNALKVVAFVNCQDPDNDGVAEAVYTNDNIYISIDGGEPIPFNMVRDTHTVAYTTVCEVEGLSDGVHTAVITSAPQLDKDSGYDAVIQSVSVGNGTIIKWSQPVYAIADDALNTNYFNFSENWRSNVEGINGLANAEAFSGADSVSFKFNGTGVKVNAQVNCQTGICYQNENVYYSIDGGERQLVNMHHPAGLIGYDYVISVAGLEKGEHTVVITTEDGGDFDQFYLNHVIVAEGELVEKAKNTVTVIRSGADENNTDTYTVHNNEGFDVIFNVIEGKYIADVKVNGTSIGAVGVYNIESVTEDTTIEVIYAYITYGVTVTVGEGGTANQATQEVKQGSTFAIEFTANEGYEIEDVLVNGTSVGAVEEYSLTVTEDVTIEVTFKEIPAVELCDVSVFVGEGGTADQATQEVEKGSTFAIAITANEGYEINDVLVNGASVGAVAEYSLTVTEDVTIVISFKEVVPALEMFDVTVTVGEGGTANKASQEVEEGSTFAIEFTANEGYEVKDVLVNGTSVGAVEEYSLTVNADVTIEVSFALIVKDGWNTLDGKWYYGVNGEMLTNTWKKDSKGWCYLGADGFMATNEWVEDSVGLCYVGSNGYCVTNKWLETEDGWVYLNTSGRMATNKWVKDSKGWCYVGEDGLMVTNKWVKDSKGWCYVGKDGYCVTNQWKKDSKGWCYLDEDGRMVISDWVKYDGEWYYLDEDGYMVVGVQIIDGKTEKFDESGVWLG